MPTPMFSVAPDGASIAYIDSGAPMNRDCYTTLLILHGFLWNADVFQKVIENASAYGIRAIAIKRRGYKGSSPFTPEELAHLESVMCTPEDRRKFMEVQALELADFIKQLVNSNMVSVCTNGQGGITILGWSLGNAYVCDFLTHVTTLPEELSSLIKQYLREYIVFDVPLNILGLPEPFSGYVSKIAEVACISDPVEAATVMADHITGSFDYPPFPEHLGSDISTWSDEERAARYGPPHDCPVGKSIRLLEAESGSTAFQACNEPGAFRSDSAIQVKAMMRGELLFNTNEIIFEDPQKTLWPGMRVEFAYGENSSPSCMYAGETSRTRFEAAVPNRKIKAIRNANHFVQWVEPKRFLEEIVQLL